MDVVPHNLTMNIEMPLLHLSPTLSDRALSSTDPLLVDAHAIALLVPLLSCLFHVDERGSSPSKSN